MAGAVTLLAVVVSVLEGFPARRALKKLLSHGIIQSKGQHHSLGECRANLTYYGPPKCFTDDSPTCGICEKLWHLYLQ